MDYLADIGNEDIMIKSNTGKTEQRDRLYEDYSKLQEDNGVKLSDKRKQNS